MLCHVVLRYVLPVSVRHKVVRYCAELQPRCREPKLA